MSPYLCIKGEEIEIWTITVDSGILCQTNQEGSQYLYKSIINIYQQTGQIYGESLQNHDLICDKKFYTG